MGRAVLVGVAAAGCGEVKARTDAGGGGGGGGTVQVTNVSSATADGTYGAGQMISIELALASPVTVTGTPTLTLSSGGTATYTSGSGGMSLTFTYTVAANESAADLDLGANPLMLAGGAITDGGEDVTLSFPAPGATGSLGANEALVIDGIAPTVTTISSTTNMGRFTAGTSIPISVTFSEAVTVTGSPVLSLNSGGAAAYASGSGTMTLVFNYTVAAGQLSLDLDAASATALTVTSATIRDGAGNDAALMVPVGSAAGALGASASIVIDTSTTWDTAFPGGGVTFSNGNRSIASASPNVIRNVRSVLGKSTGKWYWEITATAGAAANNHGGLGLVTSAFPASAEYVGALEGSIGWGYGTANSIWWMTWNGATAAGTPPAGSEVVAGTVFVFAVDLDADRAWFGQNGTWYNSGNPTAGTNPIVTGIAGTVYPGVTFYAGSTNAFTANFGGSAFAHAVPTGFNPGLY